MEIMKDSRVWKVKVIVENKDCPFLYFPTNIHGCKHPAQVGHNKDIVACNQDTCPLETDWDDRARGEY